MFLWVCFQTAAEPLRVWHLKTRPGSKLVFHRAAAHRVSLREPETNSSMDPVMYRYGPTPALASDAIQDKLMPNYETRALWQTSDLGLVQSDVSRAHCLKRFGLLWPAVWTQFKNSSRTLKFMETNQEQVWDAATSLSASLSSHELKFI